VTSPTCNSPYAQDSGTFGPNRSRQARSASPFRHDVRGQWRAWLHAPAARNEVTSPRFTRGIHSVAYGRAEASRIGPLVEYPVGERSEETLHLAIEATAPATVQALQRHNFDQKGWLHRLFDVFRAVVQYSPSAPIPSIRSNSLMRCSRLGCMALWIGRDPFAETGVGYFESSVLVEGRHHVDADDAVVGIILGVSFHAEIHVDRAVLLLAFSPYLSARALWKSVSTIDGGSER